MIKLTNINKYYNKGKSNEIHVINDVSLELPDTGFVSILGESGSGKTTLLNIIGGLDKASGLISYDDFEMKGYKMKNIDNFRVKNIGYVFQNYNLIEELTVFDNLSIVLDAIGITDYNEVKARCDYVLKKVGLYKYRKKLAKELSGGQLQRVSIARALVKKSKIIIADEPTGNLDSANSIEIMNILRSLSKKSLIILVTHNKELAEVYSDTILDIKDGKIVGIRNTDKNHKLNKDKTNAYYLKDLHKEETNGVLSAKIYSNEEAPKLDFVIVYDKGTYYLKTDAKIELLQNTNIEFLDEHYEEKTIEEIKEDLDYDDSFFQDDKVDNKTKYQKFKNLLGGGFKALKKARPRSKFFRVVLFVIGIILAIVVLNLTSRLYIDTTSIFDNNDVYVVSTTRTTLSNERVLAAKEEGLIDNLYGAYYSSYDNTAVATVNYRKNSYASSAIDINVGYIYGFDLIENNKLLYGSYPTDDNQIIIDKAFAKRLYKKFELNNYDTLLNKNLFSIYIDGDKFVISGISNAENNLCYISENKFIYNLDSATSVSGSYNFKSIKLKSTKNNKFNLVSGRIPTKYNEITLPSYKKENGDINIGDKIIINSYTYEVVGLTDDNFCYVCSEAIQVLNASSNSIRFMFTTSKLSELKEFFKKDDFSINTMKKDYKIYSIESSIGSSIALFVGALILLGIIILYIYFTMRSKMIADIKEIGVLRSIGIKKKEIINKYLVEIIINTIFTSFIGYMLVLIGGGLIISYLRNLLDTEFNVFLSPYPYLGLILLLIFNIIFGIMPIINLLRKTPSEIMAKYDI